jgi:N-methylhydantoinase A/oxoprolinase/acetone carboxylase beta subunit
VRVGIDTGGTFTDFVRLDRRRLTVHKVRSTPDDPSKAIAAGLLDIAGGFDHLDVVHGSTVATNAVLERRGARVALVATKGFEDVLRIGRQTRPSLYNWFVPAPRPIVDEALTHGVVERLTAGGRAIVPIDRASLDTLAATLLTQNVEVVAVCFLHAYANAESEQIVSAHLRDRGLKVCASHEVLSEYREFERWSTTVVNAYVAPLMERYLARLEALLNASRLVVMQSNGGSISAAAARRHPVRTILSGPAAGVVGARAVARAAGLRRVISFDMGGTSTDVSLIDGAISTTTDARIGEFPVRLPIIDIETVGAGGGSIAFVDTGGALRVGPRSAGADPGPVCCGSGEELTVTDANLLLGRLAPHLFFDGRMPIDPDRTRRVAVAMAERLSMSVEQLAEGIVRVANANMERAIRLVSLARGDDPRRFALLAFGGAGGMHACDIAERLEIRRVMIPRHAGVLSALGMLMADVTRDYSAPVLRRASEVDDAALRSYFAPLMHQAAWELQNEGYAPAKQQILRAIDVRYVGQSSELTVPCGRDFAVAFDRLHRRRYGYADPARPKEIVNVRVTASGLAAKPALPFRRPRRAFRPKPDHARSGRFGGRAIRVSHYRWDDLAPGARAAGPAVITSGEATAVIPPGFTFRIDGFGNVVAENR